MMGVEVPLPGIRTFHFTFFVSLHSTGGLAPGAMPLASGPRHCGQSARATGVLEKKPDKAAAAQKEVDRENDMVGKCRKFKKDKSSETARRSQRRAA
jgi:hypothetical protein